ncbi:unnamed protein product, partial [Discosporangium mesarthrocarpum]
NGIEAYQALKAKYEATTQARTMDLHDQFNQIKMDDSEDPDSFFERVEVLKERLEELEELVSDGRLRGIYLKGLTPEYSYVSIIRTEYAPVKIVIRTMESCNTERMKELIRDFYTNELGAMTKSRATTSTAGNQVALKADVGSDNPRSGLCFNCHKAGHRARNCPLKKHQTSKPKKWCSLHKTKKHSNEECRVQQKSA